MSEQREFIRAQLSSGVDYYKGEKGDKPVKGVDYFTSADIESIVEQIEAGQIDFSAYATKEYVDDAIEDIVETDPTVPEWAKQQNKPTYTAVEVGALPANTVIPTVPTNVSAFTNDVGYLTSHQSLDNYATKSYVEQVVAGIETGALKRSVVQSLPVSNIDENTIYMVARSGASGTDIYDEYLRVNNAWEKIGSTQVDLTNYALKSELFSGSYNDLTDKPTIPAAYTLPTASTSTLGGVKVDGSTITISNGVISASSSGGSSYTAGTGISIDANNVISNTKQSTFPFSFLSNVLPAYNAYIISAQGMTWDQFLENLRAGKVISTMNVSADWINVGSKQLDAASVAGDANAKYYVVNLSSEPANNFSANTSRALVGYAYYFDGIVLYMWISGNQWSDWINVSWGGQSAKLKTVLSTLYNNQLPATPSNDGTYFLTSTVSSGVATNSWQSVVIGGSY